MFDNSNQVFCFDMDGTIADFYSVPNWLPMLRAYDPTPYRLAKPMQNFSALARQLNAAQRKGAKLVIISWSSKESTPEFDALIEAAKREWLAKHLPSVEWDAICIVPYGTNKAEVCGAHGYSYTLFDDDERNHKDWREKGAMPFMPDAITNVLKTFNRDWA